MMWSNRGGHVHRRLHDAAADSLQTLGSCPGVTGVIRLRIVARAPFTKEQQAVATVPGIPNARVWSDDRADALLARARSEILADRSRTVNVLAISGGGSNGAYGAGLLAGWTERGERPEFRVVTGASAGALIAPFAFLGPSYDPVLKNLFSEGIGEELLQIDGLSATFRRGRVQDRTAQAPDRALCR